MSKRSAPELEARPVKKAKDDPRIALLMDATPLNRDVVGIVDEYWGVDKLRENVLRELIRASVLTHTIECHRVHIDRLLVLRTEKKEFGQDRVIHNFETGERWTMGLSPSITFGEQLYQLMTARTGRLHLGGSRMAQYFFPIDLPFDPRVVFAVSRPQSEHDTYRCTLLHAHSTLAKAVSDLMQWA